MIPKLEGVFPAITTPFKDDGEALDIETFEKHLNWLLDNGVDGIVVNGSTGEAPHLTREERSTLTKSARKMTDNSLLIVGTGGISLRETLNYSKDAVINGADAILVITPFYYKIKEENIVNYYTHLANNLPIPIILYNFPQLTGFNLDADLASTLIDGNRIIGIKDSSGDLIQIAKLVYLIEDRGYVLTGNPYISHSSLVIGADGLILAVANILPSPLKRMYEYIKDGESNKALNIYWEMFKVFLFVERYGIPGIKVVLSKMLDYPKRSRQPLHTEVDGSYAAKIAEECLYLNRNYA